MSTCSQDISLIKSRSCSFLNHTLINQDILGRRVTGRLLPSKTLHELERPFREESERISRFHVKRLIDSIPQICSMISSRPEKSIFLLPMISCNGNTFLLAFSYKHKFFLYDIFSVKWNIALFSHIAYYVVDHVLTILTIVEPQDPSTLSRGPLFE